MTIRRIISKLSPYGPVIVVVAAVIIVRWNLTWFWGREPSGDPWWIRHSYFAGRFALTGVALIIGVFYLCYWTAEGIIRYRQLRKRKDEPED